MDDPYTVRGLLSRIRSEENRRVKEVATLNFQLQKQKKKCQKLETEAKLERDKRRFKDNEIVHLKLALERRDQILAGLEKEISHCKNSHIHMNVLEKQEVKERELRSRLIEKESELFSLSSDLTDVQKSNDSLKREILVLKAKYEQLLRSEHDAIEENRHLRDRLGRVEESRDDDRALLFDNINCPDRREAMQMLIDLGHELPKTKSRLQKKVPYNHRKGYIYPKIDSSATEDNSSEEEALSL